MASKTGNRPNYKEINRDFIYCQCNNRMIFGICNNIIKK